jgi:GAF domain-containing protein
MDAVEVGSGVAGAVFAEGRALAVDDVRAQPRFSTRGSDGRYRSRAFAVAPIPRDGKPIGVVCATERGDGGAFGSADLSLLRILALQVGSLLARAEGGSLASAADVSARDAQSSAATTAPARDATQSGIAAEPAARDAAASGIAADPAVRDAQDVELARAICDAVTSELEPERIIGASLAAVAESLPAAPVSLYLVGAQGRELVLESQCERAGHADRDRLPIAAGLTGVVFQTGRLVASDDPARDGRFDAAVDTAQDGAPRPLLCVPIRLRGKALGVMRAFPEDGVHASARTAEILTAAVSAAVRNALLYRSLVEAVDEVASARRALRAQT